MAPDIETLCSLIQIFGVSLDGLCGIAPEKVDVMIEEISNFLKELEMLEEQLLQKSNFWLLG